MDEPKTELTPSPKVETPTPPTPPDYKALYEEKAKRLDELEPQYKGLQRELNKARQAQPAYVTRDDLTASEDRIAQMLEAVRGSDESYEEQPKRKPTPSEILKQHREATKAVPHQTPQENPLEVFQRFYWEERLKEEDIDLADPLVLKAVAKAKADELSPAETLKWLRAEKAKEAKQAEVKEAATRETLKQQIAKEQGWTGKDGGPNAPSKEGAKPGDWQRLHSEAKTPQELLQRYKALG